MSWWSQTWLLARREFVQRARSRAFLITMAVIATAIIGAGFLVSLVNPTEEPISVGIAGTVPEGIDTDLEATAMAFDEEVTVTYFDSEGAAEQALEDGDVDVVLVDGTGLMWWEEESIRITQIVQRAVTLNEQRSVIAELDPTPDQVARLQGTVLTTGSLNEPAPDDEANQIAAFLASMVLYVAILVFGQFVALGVVEEKQNRVVEVVLSRVDSAQILVGKVAGIGALGLAQLVALGAAVMLTLSLVEADVSLPSIGWTLAVGTVFWFILGYTLYAFVYAALGSTVSRQEDLQGVLILPVVFILPGFFIAQFAVTEPETTMVTLGSFFPLWTPFVMPMRVANGVAAGWEVALSVVLVLATAYLLIRIGARVYRGALLEIGTRVKLRDAWRMAGPAS